MQAWHPSVFWKGSVYPGASPIPRILLSPESSFPIPEGHSSHSWRGTVLSGSSSTWWLLCKMPFWPAGMLLSWETIYVDSTRTCVSSGPLRSTLVTAVWWHHLCSPLKTWPLPSSGLWVIQKWKTLEKPWFITLIIFSLTTIGENHCPFLFLGHAPRETKRHRNNFCS